MINLNASVIVFYRKDSKDRERNLQILIDYYQSNFENFEFIVVEQFKEHSNIDFDSYSNVNHIYAPDLKDTWNKMVAYNEGVKASTYENLIFNDVDVIFNPHAIKESFEILSKNTRNIILPSDGHFVCVKEHVLDDFKLNLSYEYLMLYIIQSKYDVLNYENENIHIGALTSPGGGFITKKRNIYNCNGFNVNFKGWGYEDNETLLRFNKMGYTVMRLNNQTTPLFHMNHDSSIRETNPHYNINENIYKFVSKLDSKLLFLYSNTWKM